jgi:hypothetical protein
LFGKENKLFPVIGYNFFLLWSFITPTNKCRNHQISVLDKQIFFENQICANSKHCNYCVLNMQVRSLQTAVLLRYLVRNPSQNLSRDCQFEYYTGPPKKIEKRLDVSQIFWLFAKMLCLQQRIFLLFTF